MDENPANGTKLEKVEIMESDFLHVSPEDVKMVVQTEEQQGTRTQTKSSKEMKEESKRECVLFSSDTLSKYQKQNIETADPLNSKWYGEFDQKGRISSLGSHGNVRVLEGDTLALRLYNGTIQGESFVVTLEDFFGNIRVVPPKETDYMGNIYWDLEMNEPGSIQISVSVASCFGRGKEEVSQLNSALVSNTIIVEPKLYINKSFIPSSGICMQTILSQCLGNMQHWKRRLEITSKLNYNMVHFTPLQVFGQSGSCYSLANQNEISSLFFNNEFDRPQQTRQEEGGQQGQSPGRKETHFVSQSGEETDPPRTTAEEKYRLLKDVIGELEADLGILSACDVVLNHTADNSPWLREHPESGYNLDNSPHLTAAVELDHRLQEFSRNLYHGRYLTSYGIDKNITCTQHVDSVISALKTEVILPFNIREFFTLDIHETVRSSRMGREASQAGLESARKRELDDIIERVPKNASLEEKLYQLSLCFSCSSRSRRIVIPAYVLGEMGISDIPEHVLTGVQNRLFEFTEQISNSICNSIRGLVVWERVECSKGPIGLNHWESLTPRYFTPVEDSSGRTHFLANNGWVIGWNAKEDFAAPGSFVYLRRDLIVWSDCVKLKYGKCESDSPFLWRWMSDYCRSVANVFHAIRLDNCHSTPLHVAKHMLRVCRKTRPNIWVYAELFTGDYQVDLEFERTLGLNALIREAMRAETPGSLGNYVSSYSTAPIGGLSTIPSIFQTVDFGKDLGGRSSQELQISLPILQGAKPLKKLPCPAIFFDCTHDNETPCEIRTPIDTLPTAALVASANCALGSTRGFDEIVPHNISVVSERRLYQNYIINVCSGDEKTSPLELEGLDGSKSLRSRSRSLGPFKRLSSSYLCEVPTINWNFGEIKSNSSNISTEFTIEWRHPASRVEIRGDWDDWKEGIQLEKHPNGNFITKLFIRFGTGIEQDQASEVGSRGSSKIIHPINHRLQYEYKYIVDGSWMHDPNLPYTCDDKGNTNNIITLLKRQRSIAMVSKWKHGDQLPGIMGARKILNKLHQQMARFGFNESHVHHLAQDIVMVQRYNSKIQENIYFITHSSFSRDKIDQLPGTVILDGCIKDTIFAGSLFVPNYTSVYRNDSSRIHGLDSELHKYKRLEEISNYSYDSEKNVTLISFSKFPPGSLVILHTIRHKGFSVTQDALLEFYRNTQQSLPRILTSCLESEKCHPSDAINYILFSCGNEELDRSSGARGVYNVPNLGDLAYSGIYSCIHALDTARKMDENGKNHPFVLHLKQGPWYINYTINRLREYKGTGFNGHLKPYPGYMEQSGSEDVHPLTELADWIEAQYSLINKVANIPIEYVISYIDVMFSSIYRNVLYYILNADKRKALLQVSSKEISDFFMRLDPLYVHLQLATYQVYSYVPSSPLVWKSKIPSISAGLPHFSTGFMRSWGRDTFIAFNGILISSKRYLEAKQEILGVARLMRYGLIPNLIDSGNKPRYNARDATWFFVNSTLEYCVNAPNGYQILGEDVELRFPVNLEQDMSDSQKAFDWLKVRFDYTQNQNLTSIRVLKLSDIIQYIMTKHVVGIKFREENAGVQLDEQMTDPGFNIEVSWDPSNGFIFGGNVHNCGTWMDKMGSSSKANNKGVPSSPRDGADIEIIALLYSSINHIISLQKSSNQFPHKGVTHPKSGYISYSEWLSLIKANFERCFYIPPLSCGEGCGDKEYLVDHKIVNKREIYKDTFRSTHGWTDYQLRSNLAVAIGVAKDLFDPEHAFKSIQAVEKYLFSPRMLGIKTLDPSDYNYRPDYDNSNDSEDFKVAHGFNYHQGPEWVWPMGHFLTAKYLLLKERNEKTIGSEKATKLAVSETMKHLINHRNYLISDQWGSLPELTNDNGSFCKDSCFSQAWSIGTILYFLTSIVGNQKTLEE